MNQTSKHRPGLPPATAVLGAGAWGTSLSSHLAGLGAPVRLWAFEPEVAENINQSGENQTYLPGISLNEGVWASSDLSQVLEDCRQVLLVMPSHVFRAVLSQAAPYIAPGTHIISCTKGIEGKTGFTMCQAAESILPEAHHPYLSCLSGPSFAKEVALGSPTAVVVASKSQAVAQGVQLAMAGPTFRVYTSSDLIGVELGGAMKNPLAIAAGMGHGLGLGHNTLAALVTRGLAEMTRLVVALGGQPETSAGLSGLGDLALTCYGDLSRNRGVGLKLGQGETIENITSSMQQVAEGVLNTKTVLELADRAQVELPIVNAVYQVIYRGIEPVTALSALMSRDLKPEVYF